MTCSIAAWLTSSVRSCSIGTFILYLKIPSIPSISFWISDIRWKKVQENGVLSVKFLVRKGSVLRGLNHEKRECVNSPRVSVHSTVRFKRKLKKGSKYCIKKPKNDRTYSLETLLPLKVPCAVNDKSSVYDRLTALISKINKYVT